MEHLAAFSQNNSQEQQQQQQAQQNVTQLEFTQAMNDFKTMFPDMDEDVIEIVLRANQGAVDATIDQLLQMSGEEGQKGAAIAAAAAAAGSTTSATASLTASVTEIPPKYTPPPSYQSALHHQQAVDQQNVNQLSTWTDDPFQNVDHKVTKQPINKQLFGQNNVEMATGSKRLSHNHWKPNKNSLTAKFRWNPPLLGPLAPDFLRIDPPQYAGNHCVVSSAVAIPGQNSTFDTTDRSNPSTSPLSSALLQQKMQENERQRSQLSSNLDGVESAQYLEDERIAIFLQNEEFVDELRRNREFMTALNYDAMKGRHSSSTGHSSVGNGFCNENYTGDLAANGNYEHSHHESDADFREKLKNMGKETRRKFAQLAGLFSRRKPAVPSRDNLLGGDDLYTQLENDCSDTEEGRDQRRQRDQTRGGGGGSTLHR